MDRSRVTTGGTSRHGTECQQKKKNVVQARFSLVGPHNGSVLSAAGTIRNAGRSCPLRPLPWVSPTLGTAGGVSRRSRRRLSLPAATVSGRHRKPGARSDRLRARHRDRGRSAGVALTAQQARRVSRPNSPPWAGPSTAAGTAINCRVFRAQARNECRTDGGSGSRHGTSVGLIVVPGAGTEQVSN